MTLEQAKNALLFAKISGLTPCIATEGDSEQLLFSCDSDAKIEEILKNPGLAEIVLELCERTPIETVKQALSWLDREWSRAQQFDGDTAELARLTAENLEEASRNINLQ